MPGMQRIRRLDIVSVMLTVGAVYAAIGLLIGLILFVVSLFGAGMGMASETEGAWMGIFFGGGAVIFMPILYGGLGCVGGAIAAGVYNFVSRFTGGIGVELE